MIIYRGVIITLRDPTTQARPDGASPRQSLLIDVDDERVIRRHQHIEAHVELEI